MSYFVHEQAGDGADLYGGGRQGQKRLAEDYGGHEDDDEGPNESREKRAKAELESLIQKQFRLRKAAAEDKRKEVEDRVLSYAKVKAAEFTANKISGLDVKTREDYLGRFDVKVRNICIWIFRFLWFLLSWPLNTVNNINLSLSFVQCCVSWMIYSESGYGYEFFEFFLSYPCYLSVFGTLSIKKNNTNYLQLSVIFYFTTVHCTVQNL